MVFSWSSLFKEPGLKYETHCLTIEPLNVFFQEYDVPVFFSSSRLNSDKLLIFMLIVVSGGGGNSQQANSLVTSLQLH